MMNQLKQDSLSLHVTILGWLHVAGAVLFLLMGVFVFVLLPGIGMASGNSDDIAVLGVIGTAVGLLLGVLALPGFAAGYGLLSRRNWGRVLAIVLAIFNLMNFPLGTLIGIYTVWVLFQEAASDYFMPPKPASPDHHLAIT